MENLKLKKNKCSIYLLYIDDTYPSVKFSMIKKAIRCFGKKLDKIEKKMKQA